MQTKSKLILWAVAIIVLALIAMKLLAPNSAPDTVQIQDQLADAVAAANNKDASGVMAIIASDYSDSDSNNSWRLNVMIRRGMENVDNLSASISPAAIVVNGDTAQSKCYVTIRADGQIVYNQLMVLTWQKEMTHRYLIFPEETWQVISSSYSGGLDGS